MKKRTRKPKVFVSDVGSEIKYLDEKIARSLSKRGDPYYLDRYYVVKVICEALEIQLPYMADSKMMSADGHIEIGHVFYVEDHPDQLDQNLVVVDMDQDPILVFGVICHELRHCWQRQYHSEKYTFKTTGEIGSYRSPAEIDADAYAIAVMNLTYDVPIEKIASFFCFNVMTHSQKGFQKRIIAARAIRSKLNEANYTSLFPKEEENAKQKVCKDECGRT